jgi:hypothetical protein
VASLTRSLAAEIGEATLQDPLDPFADLDLEVQRLVGHLVELPEHVVDSVVTGGLTAHVRPGNGSGRCVGPVLVLVYHRPTPDPGAQPLSGATATSR